MSSSLGVGSIKGGAARESSKEIKRPGGYPELAALINSSPSHTFQLFRRFGTLNARCLLYLQEEICELESILAEYDASEHSSASRRYDQHPDRGKLISHITTKLSQYSETPRKATF